MYMYPDPRAKRSSSSYLARDFMNSGHPCIRTNRHPSFEAPDLVLSSFVKSLVCVILRDPLRPRLRAKRDAGRQVGLKDLNCSLRITDTLPRFSTASLGKMVNVRLFVGNPSITDR